MNASRLRSIGVSDVVSGEFEPALVRVAGGERLSEPLVSLDRIPFEPPDRSGLPALARYSPLRVNGTAIVAGYTEASRGCKHLCRHCPVVPVYGGKFRIVPSEVVMEDIAAQVGAGARHITFGDPDFFNGPRHAVHIVEMLHGLYPEVTYDCTIKIEHLLQRCDLLPVLRQTGCLFVTSAVESVDDRTLEILRKGQTFADFKTVVEEFRKCNLALAPTFIPFTPWTSVEGYRQLLQAVADLDLVGNTSPVQLALRLLIVPGSPLLDIPEVREIAGPLDEGALLHRWRHRETAVDSLAARALRVVAEGQKLRKSRLEMFGALWELACERPFPENYRLEPRCTIPYMDEPWYC
jgi:hypothetical protein